MPAPAWWTPLTYTLLHGGWTHLAVNGLTLAAFGAPVARRFGPLRFLAFYAACGIAGAAAHLLLHPLDFGPVVGASAAISGTMAAVARFAFAPGAPLGERMGTMRENEGGAPPSLASNRGAMFFLAAWFGVNSSVRTVSAGRGRAGRHRLGSAYGKDSWPDWRCSMFSIRGARL